MLFKRCLAADVIAMFLLFNLAISSSCS